MILPHSTLLCTHLMPSLDSYLSTQRAGLGSLTYSMVWTETNFTHTQNLTGSALFARELQREGKNLSTSTKPQIFCVLKKQLYYISHSIILSSGDACHLMIPVGGLGMNTGVLDAYDLGWKLVATLKGWGGEKLLASYTVCTLKQSSQCSKSYRVFVLAVHKTAMANTSSINTITSDLLLWYTDQYITLYTQAHV